MNLFNNVKAKKNKLYVAEEGTVDGQYWTLDAYLPQNIEYMKKNNIKSFNSGTFLFIPCEEMRDHFIKAKQFGLNYSSTKYFYDQSIFNYYFNRNRIACISPYISKNLKMFPDSTLYYPNKILLHFSGIGDYKVKSARMHKYMVYLKKLDKKH
jgi:hypothetical protein